MLQMLRKKLGMIMMNINELMSAAVCRAGMIIT